MANLFQAIGNVKKYGLRGAIQGALNTPGGYLDKNAGANKMSQIKAKAPGGQIGYGDRAVINYFSQNRGSAVAPDSTLPVPGNNEPYTVPLPPTPMGSLPQPAMQNAASPAPMMAAPQMQADPAQELFSAPLQQQTEPRYISFNGAVYDINDPNQLAAFSAARQSYAQQLLGQAGSEYGGELGAINTDLDFLNQQENQVQNEYNTGVKGLNEAYDTGTANRANYFAQLSPNAFQSSQGSSQQYANNERLEGLGELDTTLNQNRESIATNRAAIDQDRARLAEAYNLFTSNVGQNLGAEPDAYTQPNTIGEFSFDRAAPRNANVQSVDLSQFTPYVNFDALATSPQANYFQTAAAPFRKGLSAKDSYLGYNPNQRDKDYLNQYLRKGF